MPMDRFLENLIPDASHRLICYNNINNIKESMRKIRKDFKDISGQKFGKLMALKPVNRGRRLKWQCKCDCGKPYQALGTSLRGGESKSCGNCRYSKGYDRGVSILFGRYKIKAQKREIPFFLGQSEFDNLIKQNCHYCKVEPMNALKEENSDKIKILYSGIDRIDSTKGYMKSNCVPCCKHCNLSKGNLSLDEWKQYIIRIHTCLTNS